MWSHWLTPHTRPPESPTRFVRLSTSTQVLNHRRQWRVSWTRYCISVVEALFVKHSSQVSLLSPLDKLLLYLKLPSGRPADADPLRQPLNPLGSRSEIQLTINWIRTHLEEDPQISLPKHEVYDEYIGYCTTNSVKPLSTADFGKVMKQVYPQVREF